MRSGVPPVLGRGNPRTLFYECEPSFLMSGRRVQAVAPLRASGLSVKKPGGLCLLSLQLDLPLWSLRRQNPVCRT